MRRFWEEEKLAILQKLLEGTVEPFEERFWQDFQHFHWLAGHRLSVCLPAIANMVKERVSNKANGKYFRSSEKK